MSLQFCDGFDHYGVVANMLGDIGFTNMTSFFPTTTNPRTGTSCLTNGTNAGSNLPFLTGALDTAFIYGYAHYPSQLATSFISGFYSSAGLSTSPHFQVTFNPGGFLVMTHYSSNGVPVVVYTSPIQVLFLGLYQYYEVEFFLDPTFGFCNVYREGVLIGTYSGPTSNSNLSLDASVLQLALNNNNNSYIDDFYFIRVDGTSPDTRLGPIKARTIFPSADTASAGWTLNGGATGFGILDNVPQLIATQYLTAATSGLVSEFDLTDLPVTVGSIAGIINYTFQQKSDAGVCKTQTKMISGASTDNGNDTSISTGAGYYRDKFRQDPNTSAPWTRAGFNAAKWGITRTL